MRLSCHHAFHKDCLLTWWQQTTLSVCPLCRQVENRRVYTCNIHTDWLCFLLLCTGYILLYPQIVPHKVEHEWLWYLWWLQVFYHTVWIGGILVSCFRCVCIYPVADSLMIDRILLIGVATLHLLAVYLHLFLVLQEVPQLWYYSILLCCDAFVHIAWLVHYYRARSTFIWTWRYYRAEQHCVAHHLLDLL